MISSFFRKYKEKKDKWSNYKKFGVTALYNELLSQVVPVNKIKDVTENLFFIITSALAVLFAYLSIKDGFSIINFITWSVYIFVIFSVATIGFGWLIGFISFAISLKPHVLRLVAKLLISAKSPYKDRYGLNTNELQHLKNIATTDQAAADWKNGFISVGILALLFTFIQWTSSDIENFFNKTVLTPVQTLEMNNLQSYGFFMIWLIATITIFGLVFSVFAPFVEFLTNEPINRGILNACEEAIALLETLQLDKKEKLTIKDKKQIATILLCEIVPKPTDNRYWDLNVSTFTDNRKKEWLLLPPFAVLNDSTKKAEEKLRKRNSFLQSIKLYSRTKNDTQNNKKKTSRAKNINKS